MVITLLILVVIVLFVIRAKRDGRSVIDFVFESKNFRWYGGIFAWTIMFFFMAFLVNCVQNVILIMENPGSLSSVLKVGELAMMLIGIGYLYQTIVLSHPSGTLQSPLMIFLRLLIFQENRIHTVDLFEIVNEAEKKRKETKLKELKRRKYIKPEPPKKKYFFRQE